MNEILLIVFLGILGGLSGFFIVFLLRQRSQLLKLQKELAEEKPQESSKEKVTETSSEPLEPIQRRVSLSDDEFSENLQIINNLQSKLDGMTIEMKIRGEMIAERDNKIAEMEKKVHDLSTQVSIFKEQIAPALEQSITTLRSQEAELKNTVEDQQRKLQMKDERISATREILKRAKMGDLLDLEEIQITVHEKEKFINQQGKRIKKLQEQVDQLPFICVRLTDEIKQREAEIHSLKVYNKVLNKQLVDVQRQFDQKGDESAGTINQLTQTIIELQDQIQKEKDKVAVLDREILILNGLIMEKESKISTLEAKIQSLIFK